MDVNGTDIVLLASASGPTVVARCSRPDGSGSYVVHTVLLGKDPALAQIKLAEPGVLIPENLVDSGNVLKPVSSINTTLLQSAYAALCARLIDIGIDRNASFLGLPVDARYSAKASVILPPIGSPPGSTTVGFRARCRLELASKKPLVRGCFDLSIEYSTSMPTLSGTFGWPSFGFTFIEPDFSDFRLSGRLFDLPDPKGWLPNTQVLWSGDKPSLKLTVESGVSFTIDAGGTPARGVVVLDGTEILSIDAFQVTGAVDELDVKLALSASASADVPSGDRQIGPLTISWDGVRVSAVADTSGLVISTRVESLAIVETGKPDRIAVSLDLVTRYAADGAISTTIENPRLIEPSGTQLANIAVREIGNLLRVIVPLKLPDIGDSDALLERLGAMVRSVLGWLGAGADAVGGALIGLGKGAASFAQWVFKRLAELDGSGAQILLELRWDSTNGVLKQIVVSRAGAPVSPRPFELGELKITLPAITQPMVVIDLVDQWVAVAVAPQNGNLEVHFSTDLWISGVTGTTAVRGSDADPLLRLAATLKPPAGDPEPVALILLRDSRPSFFQSLGGGRAESIGGGVSIGSPLIPGRFDARTDVTVKINGERMTSIFPTGSGSASQGSTAPKVKVKDWALIDTEGSVKKIELDLEVKIGGDNATPINAKVQGLFDVQTFELRFDALEIPISPPKDIDFFGAKARIVPNRDQQAFVLRINEAPAISLATGARAELRFDGIGEGDDVLVFDAEGPQGLALGASGLDLDAKVRQDPIRLPGLDTPFRFTSGAIQVERGRFLSAGITGSGALPPALLGEAKIDAGIQFKRDDDGSLIVESATARLERAGEPLICESTRFHFELSHVGLGFKSIDRRIQFFGELTGSATFRPNVGEFADGLLSRLPEIQINFERAPIAGDGRSLVKAMNFQIPINPPARARLFDLFEFELRGIGFHPAYDGWADTPPTLSLSGQVKMTESFDTVQASFEAHQLYVTRPAATGTLPRIRMDGLGIGLKVAAMGDFAATAIAVDGSLPGTLFKPDVLPANVTANGFLASGRLMLKGWAAMSGAAGFLELAPKDDTATIGKRHSFYIYAQQEQLSEAIPTPVGTLYLREVGFGFGFRYTLAALAATDGLTDPRDITRTLDPLSQTQGDLSSFSAWQPELEGNRLTFAMRALFSVTTASSPSVYNAAKEKDLDNPVLFDVVAALRSDLTFLLSARAWIAVNYADWLSGPRDWRDRPVLRGYIYISVPKRMFLGRLIVDPKGHIGEHPKLPKPLIDALGHVKSASATLYITPELFHQELGWPYELQLAIGDPNGTFHAALSGGMVVRIEDGAVLHGIAFRASGHVKVGGRIGGSVGAAAQARASFAIDGKFIAYVSVSRPADSIFYGRLSLALALEFSIEFWVKTRFFSLSAGWREKIDVEIDLELAVGPQGIGGHARASISLRRFGRGLRLGVSLGFNQGMLGAARGRVERFMALGLGASIPDPATGLPPLPEAQRADRAAQGDGAVEKLAELRESLPLPDSDASSEPDDITIGAPITGCDFWAIVLPLRGKSGEALLHLVPKDADPVEPTVCQKAFFGSEQHGDFFVSPAAEHGGDGHRRTGGRYLLSEVSQSSGVLDELEAPKGQVKGVPRWDAPVGKDGKATVGDLVAGGFLKAVGGKLTQPKIDPVGQKETQDTLGCIESRGALIGHVAEQARLLAQNWSDADGNGASPELDPRWLGLTFKIGDGKRTLSEVLDAIFNPAGEGGGPRSARFRVQKSDIEVSPQPGLVELFNPVERWFENAQPLLADPGICVKDQTIRLRWDLEPRWGASQSRFDDPECHLMHYAIQRYVVVLGSGKRCFHASWFAKGADTVDLLAGYCTRDYQVTDHLEDLPETLRKAIPLLLSKDSDGIDSLEPAARREAYEAWRNVFGATQGVGAAESLEPVKLVYCVVAIDNAGTCGDPSSPIELVVNAPLIERAKAFKSFGLTFDYLTQASVQSAFPASTTRLPTSLTVSILRSDLPGSHTAAVAAASDHAKKPVQAKTAANLPVVELYFDTTTQPRSGIFGADLLDADRHRHRIVSPDTPRSARLVPGTGPKGSIPVNLKVFDPTQTDPTVGPELRPYYLTGQDFKLMVGPQLATQVFARWESEAPYRPSPWTRCDLKLRISKKKQEPIPGPSHDDFIAPIAEFEPLSLSPHRLLRQGAITAGQGILHRVSPAGSAVLTRDPPETAITRDPKDRRAIRLSWNARPQSDCDGVIVSPDHVGGFDLFVASRDREAEPVPTASGLARLAQPLGRILVKPRVLLNSEPAQIEDFSKLDVAYPSATSIARGLGWYSAAESRLIWPKAMLRRSLMLVPDEGLIGEIFSQGYPEFLEVRLVSIEEQPVALPLALADLIGEDGKPVQSDRVTLGPPDKDGWRPMAAERIRPAALRELLQRLIWAFDDRHDKRSGLLWIKHDRGEHKVEVSFGGELHPVLADLLDLLRYSCTDFQNAQGYRRYEPVLEGAPPLANGGAEKGAAKGAKPPFSQLLSDTAEGSDKSGWAALRQLGLAVGFRLWDTKTSDWVNPNDHRRELFWAWQAAMARHSFKVGEIGSPFLEQLYDPEELLVLQGDDELRKPVAQTLVGLPLIQASLRPTPDRLLKHVLESDQRYSVHYVTLVVENASVNAVEIDKAFGGGKPPDHGNAYVQLLLSSSVGRSSTSVWIGSPIKDAESFKSDSEHAFGPGRSTLLARVVLAGAPKHAAVVKEQLEAALRSASGGNATIQVISVDWSPADDKCATSANPYLRFDAVPAELAALTELGADDGRKRLRDLARVRFDLTARRGADEALELQRWERRFFSQGCASRIDSLPSIGVAFATMDAPAALRRAPDRKGEISIIYIDEGQLGSWRRFYVRPFGRYDHLAQASDWLDPIEGRLVASDFGASISAKSAPWIDVTLARWREITKPVLLASAYLPEARALVLVAARSDQDILASANVPQAGAAQMSDINVGFNCALDEPRAAWAKRLLPAGDVIPELKAVALDPPDTSKFVRWLLARATPPRPNAGASGQPVAASQALPDLWRGATAVAAYDLPYFLTYSARLSASAGVAPPSATDALLPSPSPIDFELDDMPTWRIEGTDVVIHLPLARFVDCMDPDSVKTWYRTDEASSSLFELPDPAIVYRVYLRSPLGDVWASEIDIEAEPAQGGYSAHVTGHTFEAATCEPPRRDGARWNLTVRATGLTFDDAAGSSLFVVPVRQTHPMSAIKIGEAQ